MSLVVTKRRTVMMCRVMGFIDLYPNFFPQVFTREKIVGQVTREDKSFENRKIFTLYYFYFLEIKKKNFRIYL